MASDQESKLRQFVQFVGLSPDAVCFIHAETWDQALTAVDSHESRPLVIECGPTIDHPPLRAWPNIASPVASERFIFLFGPGCSNSYQDDGPRFLPRAPSEDQFSIPAMSEVRFSDHALWGPLRSLCANWRLTSESLLSTSRELADGCEPLVTIRDQPWFFLTKKYEATLFVWNGSQIPDIQEPLQSGDQEKSEPLLRLLPLLVFLRHAFGKRIWHVPFFSGNFIIDDPPVWSRYGFFQPARYLESLAHIAHATTIAFIPWYWNRSTAAATELFRKHTPRLSLCVHGCDHTGGEFASLDLATLIGKCQLARLRCGLFSKRTGLSCRLVMVFPQGRFSKAAVTALHETNFLGAVNSTLFPVDGQASDVRLSDLMEPAYMSVADFPIFLRRYPRDPVLCAIDIFLGRPLLVVEHQDYFRHGYEECRRFFQAINNLDCNLSWLPLDQIVRRACLQREIEPGRVEVRFYTSSFILENLSANSLSYRLVRRCNQRALIRSVVVNGTPVTHEFTNGEVSFELEMHPKSTAAILLVENVPSFTEVFARSMVYDVRVWTRRKLCELRDNSLWIWLFVRWLKQALHSRRKLV